MKASEVLRKARELIERDGWWQGDMGKGPNGEKCLFRAIESVEPDSDLLNTPLFFVQRAIGTPSFGRWNDDPRRTRDEVLAALARAADLAERAEGKANG